MFNAHLAPAPVKLQAWAGFRVMHMRFLDVLNGVAFLLVGAARAIARMPLVLPIQMLQLLTLVVLPPTRGRPIAAGISLAGLNGKLVQRVCGGVRLGTSLTTTSGSGGHASRSAPFAPPFTRLGKEEPLGSRAGMGLQLPSSEQWVEWRGLTESVGSCVRIGYGAERAVGGSRKGCR